MKKIIQIFPIALLLFLVVGCKSEQTKTQDVASNRVKKQEKSTEPAKISKKTILCFGNSLTAGYGLEDESMAWPALLQNRLNEMGANYSVVNAGLSGETSSGGLNRIDWVLKSPVDIFILELGANDMLRGFDIKQAESNLREILNIVRQKYPESEIVIAGMLAPPNLGKEYQVAYDNIFPNLAKEFNGALIPFFLEGVALREDLNLPDGIHPNVEGQKIVLENVWKAVAGLLEVS